VKKKGTSLDNPGMPGWKKPDEPECPCWDFDTLVQVVACSGFPLVEAHPDPTANQISFDFAAFQNSAAGFVLVMAGYNPFDIQFPDDAKECLIDTSIGQISMGEGKVPYKATSENEDLACRLDVLELIEPYILLEVDIPKCVGL
jgi:hypothetical protein